MWTIGVSAIVTLPCFRQLITDPARESNRAAERLPFDRGGGVSRAGEPSATAKSAPGAFPPFASAPRHLRSEALCSGESRRRASGSARGEVIGEDGSVDLEHKQGRRIAFDFQLDRDRFRDGQLVRARVGRLRLAQPHARPLPVLLHEDHAGGFEGRQAGLAAKAFWNVGVSFGRRFNPKS
jgi:hypothetical protein